MNSNPPNLETANLDLSRVNVIGTSGVGKSTFSRQLARQLNVRRIEMDQLYWESNWQEPDVETFRQRVTEAVSGDRWILDGNYSSKTEDIKWRRATAVIWLDYSFSRTFIQAFGRAVDRIKTQKEIWPGTGNRESFRRTFLSHESVLLWTITSYHRVRKRYLAKMQNPELAHLTFVRLTNRQQAEQFLKQFHTGQSTPPAVET